MLADAASVTLAWDASISTNVVGYRVYYRTTNEAVYTTYRITSGLELQVTNLSAGMQYRFVVTAIGLVGTNLVESVYSTEVESTTPSLPPLPKPDPPTNIRVITNSLQSSLSVDGPWMTVAQLLYLVPTNDTRFYRARMDGGFQ